MSGWYDDAECAKPDVSIDFFSDDPLEVDMAKSVCAECPVRKQCLQYALNEQIRFGVWGGVDEKTLRKSLGIDQFGKPTRKGRTVPCPNCGSMDLSYSNKERTKLKFTCDDCGLSWWSRRTAKVVEIDPDEDMEGFIPAGSTE